MLYSLTRSLTIKTSVVIAPPDSRVIICASLTDFPKREICPSDISTLTLFFIHHTQKPNITAANSIYLRDLLVFY